MLDRGAKGLLRFPVSFSYRFLPCGVHARRNEL